VRSLSSILFFLIQCLGAFLALNPFSFSPSTCLFLISPPMQNQWFLMTGFIPPLFPFWTGSCLGWADFMPSVFPGVMAGCVPPPWLVPVLSLRSYFVLPLFQWRGRPPTNPQMDDICRCNHSFLWAVPSGGPSQDPSFPYLSLANSALSGTRFLNRPPSFRHRRDIQIAPPSFSLRFPSPIPALLFASNGTPSCEIVFLGSPLDCPWTIHYSPHPHFPPLDEPCARLGTSLPRLGFGL